MKKLLFSGLIFTVLIGLPFITSRIEDSTVIIHQPEKDSLSSPETEITLETEITSTNSYAFKSNDQYFDKQWALIQMQIAKVWELTLGSQEILIAVLDTGIDQKHEDLLGKVVAAVNFSDSPTADDFHGHGTHLAGIIAANTNNALGIAGIVPNARLLNVKVANDRGVFTIAALAKGIIWAVDSGAKVINISLTTNQSSPALKEAIDYAWGHGAVVVAAAGNFKESELIYPACYQNCLAVTSTDLDDSLSLWANCSDWVDVAAPGRNIYSTLPNNSYGYKHGNSCAAAQVSGVAALLFGVVADENGNGFLNDEIRTIIENSGTNVGREGMNIKRVNALQAVMMAINY